MIKRCILISITIHLIWRRIDRQGGEGREGGQGSLVGDGGSGAGHRMLISHNINVYNRMCNVSNEKHNNVPSNDITYVYIYIYIYIYVIYIYRCVYIYIYIYTNTPQCPAPNTPFFSCRSFSFLITARITARGAHSALGLIRRVHASRSSWRGPLEISSGKVRVQCGTRSRVPLIPITGSYPISGIVRAARVPIAGLVYKLWK